jgi:hypothetical protein
MSEAFEHVTREAMRLSARQRLALAGYLLELDEASDDGGVEAAWEEEIRARIEAIQSGRAVGIPYADVMREADKRLAR